MSLSQRIKLLINSKKISQSEFARELDVTRGSVNQWLSGKLVPGHKPLMKIFEIFPDISADWLLLGKGKMTFEENFGDKDNTYLKKQLEDQAEKIGLYRKLLEEKDARIQMMDSMINALKENPSKNK
jgi:transcriptional regulator with XRE-family HTH domain